MPAVARAGSAPEDPVRRAAARRAAAPLAGAARLVGQAGLVPVARAEQLGQDARLLAEQQLRDVSHVATSSSSEITI
jgi:hypothetical protein